MYHIEEKKIKWKDYGDEGWKPIIRGEFDLANLLGSFIDVVGRIVLHPIRFFAESPRGGSLLNPLLFALICGEISAILRGLLELIGIRRGTQGGVFGTSFVIPVLDTSFSLSGGLFESLRGSVLGFIGVLIVAPIIGAIALFIAAGLLQLVIRVIIGAENSGFRATFRIPSYAAVVNLVSWIPIIGTLLSLYGLYLQIVGLREIHETTSGRAILAYVTYAVVWLIIVAALTGATLLITSGSGWTLSKR